MDKDLRSYFTIKENQSQAAIPEFFTSLSGNVSQAKFSLISEDLENLENITIKMLQNASKQKLVTTP